MQIVTVSPKYEIIIPREIREKIKGIKPGAKMSIYAQDARTIVLKNDKVLKPFKELKIILLEDIQ